MSAFNVVRFRVKPGRDADFIALNEVFPNQQLEGLVRTTLIKTGDRSYCLIGEWTGFEAIVNARPAMIGSLDKMRPLLEDLGHGLGVTDPVSGEAVLDSKP